MAELLRAAPGALRLSSLLQVVELEGVTGVLHLGGHARLGFRAGVLHEACHGGLTGLDAALEAFFLDADALLEQAEVGEGSGPLAPTMRLVIDGSRLVDEWARCAPLVLIPADGAAPALPDGLAAALDGRTPTWAAVAAAGLPRCRVVDPVQAALHDGLLREAGAPVPPLDVGGRPMDFDAWLALGRRLCREDRLDEARVAFQNALAERADDRIARQNLRHVERRLGLA